MTLPEPKSRKEQFLAKAAGEDVGTLPDPASREEEYLSAIAEGGSGGSGVKVTALTQDEYDALATKDENTLYVIKPEGE